MRYNILCCNCKWGRRLKESPTNIRIPPAYVKDVLRCSKYNMLVFEDTIDQTNAVNPFIEKITKCSEFIESTIPFEIRGLLYG